MAIQGLRHTDNWVTNEREGVWRKGIFRTSYNGDVPFTALTAGMKGNSKVTDPKFSWWQKDERNRRLVLSGNLGTGVVPETITVAEGAKQVRANAVLLVEKTGEYLRVLNDPTTDTALYVERQFNSSVAAAVTVDTDNPNAMIVGTAFREGANAPGGVAYSPGEEFNYTQIFKNTYEITRTAMNTKTRSMNDIKELRKDCHKDHIQDLERAFIWGKRGKAGSSQTAERYTGGIISYIPTTNKGNTVNTWDKFGDTVDLDYIENMMEIIFLKGSQEKMCFCGNRFLNTLNKAIRKNNADYQFQKPATEYGMKIKRLETPFGTLVFKTHPEFNKLPGRYTGTNDYKGWDSAGLIVDLENCAYKYITDTTHKKNLEENDADGVKQGFLTEAGLEIGSPDTHFLLEGWHEAAADV